MDKNLAETRKNTSHDAAPVYKNPIRVPEMTPYTLVNLFFNQVAKHGDATQFAAKTDGTWQCWSWRKIAEQSSALAVALLGFGVKIGDRVALVSENRPEWGLSDLAILMCRAITVPVYITNTAQDHHHVFDNSGAKLVIVSNPNLAGRVIEAAALAAIPIVISFEPLPAALQAEAAKHNIKLYLLADLVKAAPAAHHDMTTNPQAIWRGAAAGEISRLSYTSGTGGKPRGVMLSHDNILANIEGCLERFQAVLQQPNRRLPEQILPSSQRVPERFLSFLPLSHCYEHTVGLYLAMALGAEVYFCEAADKLMPYLLETQPTLVTLVPRIYEMLFHRIEGNLAASPQWQKWLFRITRDYGLAKYDRTWHPGRVLNPLLTLLVRRKMRARFGGRVKALVSGGAALSVDMARYFNGLGLPVCQGYGQTESSPVISFNPPDRPRLHTVGMLLPEVECRIAADGEICIRGRLVMQGYWRDEAATAQAIQAGWLHTGDVGRIEEGYLIITDRKRDIIKLSGGDTLSPARIEGVITLAPEIAQAMVMGDGQAALAAVLVPSADFITHYATTHQVAPDLALLCHDQDFHRSLAAILERACAGLSNLERVRRFTIASEPFSMQNNMMTPSFKLRRHVIREKYPYPTQPGQKK
ncbi:MAG: AMP-dependent synthetase/ligase [Candidatus Symbiobacter sp.]|nr:AMP-dependent synthetase/ligase [Candidatus Symbiobacter sp.]